MLAPSVRVWFLYDYDLVSASVISIGRTNVKVLVSAHKGIVEHVRYVKPDKLIDQALPFCVVWDLTKGRNGRGSYRLETALYPDRHSVGWKSTSDYVRETQSNKKLTVPTTVEPVVAQTQ